MTKKNSFDFLIYGERNSGTNYLKELLETNYNANYLNYKHNDNKFILDNTWKHCLINYENYNYIDNVFCFVISREIYPWLQSMYKKPYFITKSNNFSEFISEKYFKLNHEVDNYEIDLYNRESFINIIDCYNQKYYNYFYKLPHCFKNYIHIRYEDLLETDGQILKQLLYLKGVESNNFTNVINNSAKHIQTNKTFYDQKKNINLYKEKYNKNDINYINKYLDKNLYNDLGYKIFKINE